jgi:hypothetical protein
VCRRCFLLFDASEKFLHRSFPFSLRYLGIAARKHIECRKPRSLGRNLSPNFEKLQGGGYLFSATCIRFFVNQNSYYHEHANRKSLTVYTALLICFALVSITGCKQDSTTDPVSVSQSPNSKRGTPDLSNNLTSEEKFAEETAKRQREASLLEAIAAANRERYGHKMLIDKSTETGLTLQELREDVKRRGLTMNETFRPLTKNSGEMQVFSGFGLYGGVVLAYNEFEVYSAAYTYGVGNQFSQFRQVDLTHEVYLQNTGDPYLAFSRTTSGVTEATSVADFTFPGFGPGRAVGIHSGFSTTTGFEPFQTEYILGLWDW